MTSGVLTGVLIGSIVGALVGAGSVLVASASFNGSGMMGHMGGGSSMDDMMDDESMAQMHEDCKRHMEEGHHNQTSPTPT